MRVLVVYQLLDNSYRNTISEHLQSFSKYSNNSFHYLNVIEAIPNIVVNTTYDVIIFHYTFLAIRFNEDENVWKKATEKCELLRGYKIAMPQDEYDHTTRLEKFILKKEIDHVYTCFYRDEDIRLAYGFKVLEQTRITKTYTGFVDEITVEKYARRLKELKDRKIDIGYRARKLPPYFGRHGQLKYELVIFFQKFLRDTKLNIDISNTNQGFDNNESETTKNGSDWLEFLGDCKAFIGCEGGSSLLDKDGDIQIKVKNYLTINPHASFDEVEKECFKGLDYQINCFAISPRHFECALTKTLQILVEGDYAGIFKPNRHYLELKRDFSNAEEIIGKLEDLNLCQAIVDQAYEEIVKSGKYTYRAFIYDLFRNVSAHNNHRHGSIFSFKLKALILRKKALDYKIRRAIFLAVPIIKQYIKDRYINLIH